MLLRNALAIGMLAACCAQAVQGQAIFTCIDSKGRRITADRPIADCIDREQKELNPSGTLRRKVGPSLTAEERAAEDEKARKVAEERNRAAEQKKRERAMLARYPDKARHDAERASALGTVDVVIAASNVRTAELQGRRKALDTEAEFYRKDPTKYPPRLKRAIEEIDAQLAAQQRFVADQTEEKKRINTRFDEELARLKMLWAQAEPVAAGKAPAKAP